MKSVIVKDLCFEYEENIPTIQNVSFEIDAGWIIREKVRRYYG